MSQNFYLKWQRWYPTYWNSSPFVIRSDFETRGLYFQLLQLQMLFGSIPADIQILVRDLQCPDLTVERFLVIWEREQWKSRFDGDKNRLKDLFVPLEYEWLPDLPKSYGSVDPKDGEWVPLETKRPDCLINPFLTQVMSVGKKTYSRKVTENSFSDETPGKKSPDSEDSHPNHLNFDKILKSYPRKNNRAGWFQGIEMMKNSITTDQQYVELLAAVKAYRAENPQPKYVKRLDRFMTDWRGYIPTSFKASEAFKAPISDGESEGVPQLKIVSRADNETPPWTPGAYDESWTIENRNLYWTEERKQAWHKYEELPDYLETLAAAKAAKTQSGGSSNGV